MQTSRFPNVRLCSRHWPVPRFRQRSSAGRGRSANETLPNRWTKRQSDHLESEILAWSCPRMRHEQKKVVSDGCCTAKLSLLSTTESLNVSVYIIYRRAYGQTWQQVLSITSLPLFNEYTNVHLLIIIPKDRNSREETSVSDQASWSKFINYLKNLCCVFFYLHGILHLQINCFLSIINPLVDREIFHSKFHCNFWMISIYTLNRTYPTIPAQAFYYIYLSLVCMSSI